MVSGSTCRDLQDPLGLLEHHHPPTLKEQVSLALQVHLVLQALQASQERHLMTSRTESSATFKVKVLGPQVPPGLQELSLLMMSSLSCSGMM